MNKVIGLILLLGLASCSCSKEEVLLGPIDMWKKAESFDPKIELVFIPDTPEGQTKRVLCGHYRKEGCVAGSGKRIKVRLVELITLQYEHTKQACLAAQEIGQWYAYNWVFDDVTNEPVLEDYVVKAFDAKKPAHPKDCDL